MLPDQRFRLGIRCWSGLKAWAGMVWLSGGQSAWQLYDFGVWVVVKLAAELLCISRRLQFGQVWRGGAKVRRFGQAMRKSAPAV